MHVGIVQYVTETDENVPMNDAISSVESFYSLYHEHAFLLLYILIVGVYRSDHH